MRFGAGIDPPNRFERVRAEADDEHLEWDREPQEPPSRPVEYVADESRSIVSENQSPDIPFRYSVNPYRGCVHACSYCYARPYHEYLGFNAGRDFETKILVKPDAARLFHAGHLGCQTRHPDGLRSMLASYFELPVEIEEFVGRWIDLPADSHWRLGESPETGSLGATTVIGARTWDVQGKFRIRLGPLSRKQYERLLPGSESLDRLTAMVRSYVGDELSWELNPVLRKEDTPPLRAWPVDRRVNNARNEGEDLIVAAGDELSP